MKADVSKAREIWRAMQAFQDAVPAVKKDGDNPFFNSRYATLEKVISSIKEPCKIAKIAYQQWADGLEIHTRVFMLDNPDDYIEQVLEMGLDANPQRMGSAITYYRRYSLGLIFNLQFDDDDGNAAAGFPSRPASRANQQRASAPAAKPAKKIMGDFNFNEMLAAFKAATSSAAMKQIAADYKNRFEMNEAQKETANEVFQKRFNYLKKVNK